jgi:hypothetical protein
MESREPSELRRLDRLSAVSALADLAAIVRLRARGVAQITFSAQEQGH